MTALAVLAAIFGSAPGQPFAGTYLRLAMTISPSIDDLSSKAWSALFMGTYLLTIGHWNEGLHILEEGCGFCEQIGYRRLWEEIWATSAVLLYRRGEFDESIQRWEEVYTSANRRDNAQPQVWGLCGMVEIALWNEQEMGYSIAHLQESLGHLEAQNISLNEHVRTRGLLALAYMRQGDHELARQEVDIVLELVKQSNILITYTYDGYVAPADVYLALWEMEVERQGTNARELTRLARQGIKKSAEFGRTYPIFKPRALYYQGRYDWLSGKQLKAQKAWLKGIDLAQGLDMPHEAGLLHLEYGRHLPLDDPKREKHLTQALDLFTNVGAHYFINRTREEMNIEHAS